MQQNPKQCLGHSFNQNFYKFYKLIYLRASVVTFADIFACYLLFINRFFYSISVGWCDEKIKAFKI